jgi:hypothetical protein
MATTARAEPADRQCVKRILLSVVLAALVAAPTALALDPGETKALLRVAVRLSGLSARAPVRVVVEQPARFRQRRVTMLDRLYPRAAQDHDETVYRALGLVTGGTGALRKALLEAQDATGLYDPAARIGFVQAGRGERASALREVVHALQDQNVDLGRIPRLLGGGDARIAAAAAVEGYASLVTAALPRRSTASPRGSRLARFVELERGFASSVGLRFAANVHNLGGTRAMIGSLRRFPATTEQVFHLDKYLEREAAAPTRLPAEVSGMTLVGSSTFGELDVRALLAVFGIPGLDRAGTGWGGGSTARYAGAGGAVSVALDWDTALDATQWAEAVTPYVDAAFDAAKAGRPELTSCGATMCWRIGTRAIAFDRSGRRTVLVIGADPDAVEALARAITGRP